MMKCGTVTMYMSGGCRCAECLTAVREYQRSQRASEAQRQQARREDPRRLNSSPQFEARVSAAVKSLRSGETRASVREIHGAIVVATALEDLQPRKAER